MVAIRIYDHIFYLIYYIIKFMYYICYIDLLYCQLRRPTLQLLTLMFLEGKVETSSTGHDFIVKML